MKAPIIIVSVLFLLSCRLKTTNINEKELDKTNQNADPCLNERLHFDTILVFKKGDSILPTKDFFKMVKFIESKGSVRLKTFDSLTNKIYNTVDVYLTHEIHCWDRFVRQRFVLKNVTRTTCIFESTHIVTDPDLCYGGPCYPEFFFQQCNFADNRDRDSALKIIKWVFFNLTIDGAVKEPKDHDHKDWEVLNETMDFKHLNAQIVIADKRLYLLKPARWKPAIPLAIESAGYLRQFLKENKLD